MATGELNSLYQCFCSGMTDPRKAKGLRHKLACCLTIIALATAAGCRGPHAIAEFAHGLNHAQRRQLRCRPRPGRPREYDVPQERTIRRLLKRVDPEELKAVLVRWMEQEDRTRPKVIHADGKVVKNADPAPARSATDTPSPEPVEPSEIPVELQKPKADKALTLVNFQTTDQRLVDQIAVPRDTNEEAAVAAHLPKMDLAGICLTTDAAHLVKANCRQLTQKQRRGILHIPQSQPAHGAGQSRATAARQHPPLRPAHWTKPTGESNCVSCGARLPTQRRWAWPGWPKWVASTATPNMSAKAR